MDQLADHATRLLSRLIAHNTVNPPGNERALQEELAADLKDAGFEVTLVGRTEERPNLVARLRGAADGPTLCLLSHCDTVLANADEWTHDPWCGEVIDGQLWGRGALDMKSQTAAEVAAGIELANSGWRPANRLQASKDMPNGPIYRRQVEHLRRAEEIAGPAAAA